MAYKEEYLTRGTIKITDPETGLSETGPRSTRAKMKERLASKIMNRGTITSDTKLGADPKPYKRKKKAEVKKKTEAVFPDIMAHTEEEMVAPVKKGVGGGAVMEGYVKDTLGKSGIKSIVTSAVKEVLRKKQPDDATTTGVVEKKNIPERYESKIKKMDELGKEDSGGTMFGDGFMGPGEDVQQYKEKEVSATPSPHDRNIPEAQREVLKKPSFMGQRKWDAIPVSQRRKVLENIKRTEEKNAIKSGVASDLFKEVSHILSAASPISWVNPADNKYTMLPNVDKKFRETVNLAQPDMDSKLKGEEGRRGQIEYGRGEYDRQEAPVVTNEDGGLMKKLKI